MNRTSLCPGKVGTSKSAEIKKKRVSGKAGENQHGQIVEKKVPATGRNSPPFYCLRRVVHDRHRFHQALKSIRKAMKQLGVNKSVNPSFRKYLGDKTMYNLKEMLADVQKGLKLHDDESNYCSLQSVVRNPPRARKEIQPLNWEQMSGFRLFGTVPLFPEKTYASSSTDARQKGNSQTDGTFKIPANPRGRRPRGQSLTRGRRGRRK